MPNYYDRYDNSDEIIVTEDSRISYIRHWFIQEFGFWNNSRLIKTICSLNLKHFYGLTPKEIINNMGVILKQIHTSPKKHIIIDSACEYALNLLKDTDSYGWLEIIGNE